MSCPRAETATGAAMAQENPCAVGPSNAKAVQRPDKADTIFSQLVKISGVAVSSQRHWDKEGKKKK